MLPFDALRRVISISFSPMRADRFPPLNSRSPSSTSSREKVAICPRSSRSSGSMASAGLPCVGALRIAALDDAADAELQALSAGERQFQHRAPGRRLDPLAL